jgi:hypothetical protein
MSELGIKRDRWGRPLIEPPGGGKPEPYTRVSTLAKTLDDKTALAKWMCRQTAIGLSRRADLVSMVAASPDSKTLVGDAVEQAMASAKSGEAANIGTTLHALSEAWDGGTYDPTFVSTELQADLAQYAKATAGLEMVHTEGFVVIDELLAAGSFDRLARLPDGRLVVADIKTGQNEPQYPHGVTTQVAMYSRGTLYHPETGRGQSLQEMGVDQTTGLLIHLPAGQATCRLYLIDLEIGWALASVAARVRQMQKLKPLTEYTPGQ